MPQTPASHERSSRLSDADATGQLDMLDADDILESDDISALEAAAAGIVSFEVAPASEPNGFEVGDVGAFDEVEVEGEGEAAPPSLSTLLGVKAKPVKSAPVQPEPAVVQAEIAIPPAPITSRLPLENVIVAEPVAERTLEIKGADLATVAAAAAKLEAQEQPSAQQNGQDHTEVLVRSAMPSALQAVAGGMHAPAARRPSSIAPVALDVAASRPMMQSTPAFPPPPRMPSHASMMPPKRGLSGIAIGAIAFSALALVGLVGVGGYAASRALTDKSDPVALANAPSETAATPESAAAAAGVSSEANPAFGAIVAPSTGNPPNAPASLGTGAAIDVSALPTAPAPRSFTGRTTAPSAPAAAPLAAAGPATHSSPATKTPGALPPPGPLPPPGGASKGTPAPGPAGAPLPPPAAPAPVAAAPAAPAVVSTTGTVRVDPSLRAVVVDGNFRRANDGVLTVTCGSHRIKVGMKEPQTVNVPCGGSVSL